MKNLISVVCTVKNGNNTLIPTLESVLNQSYNNFEFIIVDDGSTDDTLDILERYQKNNKNIKIIKTEGIGRSRALNLAIRSAQGKYIANIDADDLWHPLKLEKQVDAVKDNLDYFLLATDTLIIYDDAMPLWKDYSHNKETQIKTISDNLLISNPIAHHSVLINREQLIKLDLYDENRATLVDYELWLRAFENGYEMKIMQLDLAAKRIHQNQSFENKKRIKYIFDASILQLQHIMNQRRWLLLPIPIVKFLLGLLPFKIRNRINKIIKIKK